MPSFILQTFLEDLRNEKHSAVPHGECKHETEIVPALKELSVKEGWVKHNHKEREKVRNTLWGCREVAKDHRASGIPPIWQPGFLSQRDQSEEHICLSRPGPPRQDSGNVSGNIFTEIKFAVSDWHSIWLISPTNLYYSFPFSIHCLSFLKNSLSKHILNFCCVFVDMRHFDKS